MKIKPVILAGGVGTRLWPLSCKHNPKQFLKIFNGQSLLQKTLIRNKIFGKPTLIINQEHQLLTIKQANEIGIEIDLIIEPIQRDTAPGAIIATLQLKQQGWDTILLLPADHLIYNTKEYIKTISQSFEYAQQLGVCTLGIPPTFPSTEYGYIEIGPPIATNIYTSLSFTEKPLQPLAQSFVDHGGYFWNSGIFIYNIDFFIKQVTLIQPALFKQLQNALNHSEKNNNSLKILLKTYIKIPKTSLDYTIIEHIKAMAMIKVNFQWSDLGDWHSLWQFQPKDLADNYCQGDIITHDTTNCYISSLNKLVTVIGLDNMIIINTDNSILVANKSKIKEIKQVINQMSKLERQEV